MWGSFEHAGRLVDGLRPELQVLILQLLGSPVQGFGDQPALWHVTLEKQTQQLERPGAVDRAEFSSRSPEKQGLVLWSCIKTLR